MADQEARREARRRKILQNSENRLNRLLGKPTTVINEPAEASDGTSGPDPPSDRSNSTISSPVPATPGSADETLSRVSHMPDPATLGDFQTSTASARQRAHKSPPSESTEPAQKLPAAEEHPENAPFQAYQSRNGVRDVPVPGKDGSAPVDHVKVLDQMRCGGCLLVALLTRWALSVGLGMLFLEFVIVPFIVLEVSLFYFQQRHMKDIQLPHRNSMMTYALVLSGIKPDLITKYNAVMGYVTALTEDFALYLFSFLLFHAVLA